MAQLHRPSAWLLVTTLVCTPVVTAQQPTFRAKIDSLQLDVRVVYEDGQPQAISTFAMVDLPASMVPVTLTYDVVSNATGPGRLLVLVLDNYDNTTLANEMRDLVTAATRANVSIYPIDARGLPTGPYGAIRPVPMPGTAVENDRGTVFAEHRESQTADMAQGKAATYRHAAQIPLQTIPPGSYVLTVRAETGTAPGRPVIRRVPIEIR